MIRALIKREFLNQLLSFRSIAFILMVAVPVSIGTAVLANGYGDRLRNYTKGDAVSQESFSRAAVDSGVFEIFRIRYSFIWIQHKSSITG